MGKVVILAQVYENMKLVTQLVPCHTMKSSLTTMIAELLNLCHQTVAKTKSITNTVNLKIN